MIKYYCEEITEGRVIAKFECKIIPSPYHTTDLCLHKECAIGKDRIAQMQVEADERKRKAEERRKARGNTK